MGPVGDFLDEMDTQNSSNMLKPGMHLPRAVIFDIYVKFWGYQMR